MDERLEYHYDKNKAERPERFFKSMLVLPDGEYAGSPFALDPWQGLFLRDALGYYDSEGELKHIMNWLEVPKGNGKTPLLAGLALYFAGWCNIINGEIYMAAVTRKQAAKMLKDCKDMIRLSGLSSLFVVQQHKIIHKKTGTRIEVLSSEAGANEGLRPDKIIFDEIQEQPNDRLYSVLMNGLTKKKNAQAYMIGTAGIVNTFPHNRHDYAVKVKEGIIKNPSWNVHIYTAGRNVKIWDVETWKKANPGLGTIKSLKRLKKIAKDAQDDQAMVNEFKRLHLNIWVSSTVEWIPLNLFRANNKGKIDLEYHRKNQTPCYGALDIASTEDLSAFSMMFIEEKNGKPTRIDWKVWFWCPNDRVGKKAKRENVNYPAWVAEKYVFATAGNVQDKDEILNFVEDQNEVYNLKIVNVDTSFHRAVIGARIETSRVNWEPHSQDKMAMTIPTKEFRIWLGNKLVNYGGNPVLEWQISNCEAFVDANENVKLMKGLGKGKGAGSVRKKIDGVVAGVMSVSGYMSMKTKVDENTAQAFW